MPAGMHPHGVRYAKDSEGAPYNDGTSGADKSDDAVAPGRAHTYVWQVPERAGPGPGDGSSAMWMYHSHSDEVADSYAGLIGPVTITKRGMANADGSPNDVDRQFVVNFMVANENKNPNLKRNIRRYAYDPRAALRLVDDEDFQESNMGSEVDLHAPHWHGNVVTTTMGMRTDVLQLLAGTMQTADMQPDDLGTWLFHCHINDHITAGMLTRYHVDPA